MAHSLKLPHWIARLRAALFATLILVLAACESTEPLNPDSSTPGDAAGEVPAASPEVASAAFAGGIPFGTFRQPTSAFGSRFNGAHRNIAPYALVSELRAIKARGGKVVLMFAGNERHYKVGGHFSITKWKARVNRFRGVNFSSYINDGTIIGHYMIDEPNDRHNWGGRPISPAVLEEMARYSKQLWPKMPTIVRVQPDYLGSNHRHLDAAWAQYLHRRGNAGDYIRKMVSSAQKRRLGLIVGLNVIGGGPHGRRMTASEVKSWGSTLLGSSYPCAFISWQYNAGYLSPNSMKDAMSALRRKAQSRGFKSCRGS
jgi:hypothetical protein